MITLHPNDIEVGERHRALSEDAVQRLAGSMKDVGLLQPITVRVADEMMVDGELTSGVPILVAGAHRLAAAKSLGWDEIDCIEINDDTVEAELCEIAENLHRLDLTKDQRDEHIRRYAELLTEKRKIGQIAAFSEVGAGRGNKSVAREIADQIGLSKDTVQRALRPKSQGVPIAPAPLDPEDAYNKWATAMNRLWGSAPMDWRDRWECERDAPVMDRRYA